MPRPKRSKVAPSIPAPRVTKSMKSAVQPISVPRAPDAGFDDMYDVSDPDEGGVRSARRVKKDNGKGKAAGARQGTNARDLEKEDSLSEPGENFKGKDRISPKTLGGEAGIEDIDLESSSPAVEVGRRERGTPAAEHSLLALGNFRRRPRQPSILGRAAARARSSSVESNLAQDTGLATVGKRNNSVLGVRHSRQPSITGTNEHARSASIGHVGGTPAHGGSILNLGNFKRRARQPSILGTAQKDRQPRPEYEAQEDDFNPEDESTPLNLSKTRDVTGSSSASNPRKRKLSATQLPRSSPPVLSDGESELHDDILATEPQHDESEEEPHSSDEAVLPSVEAQEINEEPMSETMAPPLSSSVTPSPEPEPASYRAAQRLRAEREAPRGRRRLRDGTPPSYSQDSPISSPPSLTHSPNFRAEKAVPKSKRRQRPLPSTLSTAQLQALLPRRRRRRGARDPYDIASEDEIDVSGLASDDDELTHSTVRAAPSRRNIVPRIPPSGKAARKLKVVPKPGTKQTYGSRAAHTTSDKENEEVDPDDSLAPLPDDDTNGSPENSQELEKRVGKELKKAAKKFEEVDKWELDFEECTASSSSPKDAR
ncbi:hypothetical protein D0Z07_6530 [Hyphodiscus hymeniophilus]|uniref:Uncharacterized protein n=1 Tax=Hyphodiscus hymeniophilus TaxID=353542 RepID=A0A9P7AVY0_9HELO|nr:hypothetical protein D0Z07_6530 [Hyphodiscus hymeniophilus]